MTYSGRKAVKTSMFPESEYSIPKYAVQLTKESMISVDRKIIRTPDDVAAIVMPTLRHELQEHATVLVLSTKNHVLGIMTIGIGSLNACIVHPREVFRAAILSNAASVIFVHNHPSGDPAPSREDIELTNKLVEAGKILDIPLLDSVIIGDGEFESLKEKGVM